MPLPLTDFFIDKPKAAKARLLLAHGAGAGSDSDFMQQLSALLVSHNIEVWRFNFAYMQRFIATGKRSLPDKMPPLQQQFVHAINTCPDDLPLFIAGKSMGGRVATLLHEQVRVKAVFAFGYPFHAPKKPSWRTEHFAHLTCPVIIMQGERDAFGCKAELADKSWLKVSVNWLPDGDHDFKPRVKSGYSQQQLIASAALFCSEKIDEVLLAAKQ